MGFFGAVAVPEPDPTSVDPGVLLGPVELVEVVNVAALNADNRATSFTIA